VAQILSPYDRFNRYTKPQQSGAIMNTIILCHENSSIISRLFLFLTLVIAPAVLFAQDISIWDFRIPETKYQRLTGSLSGGWNKTDNNSTYYNFGTLQDHSSNSSKSSSAQSALSYNFANYNENNSLEIAANVTGQANHNSNDGNYLDVTSYYQSSSQLNSNYNVFISPDIRYSNYIVPDTWHWFAEGSGYYSFNQYTNHSNTIYSDGSHSYDSSFSKNNFWYASVGGGIGYGKLRDGSAVFAVLRILDKLTEDSALVRPLTKDEVLQIVNIYAIKVEYSYTQDRYVKYFMEDIFSQLQKMGVLKENAATAYSVLRAVEVLSEQIEPRLFGWRARIGVQRTYTEEVSAASEMYPQNYTSNYLWYFHDYVTLALDYGYPLTLNFQVNSNLFVEIPSIDYQRKIGYTFQLAGIYQVGERIDATISGSVSRNTTLYQSADENEFLRNVQYNAGVSFRFFIENNVNFNVSCGYSEWHQDYFSLSTSGNNVYKSPAVSFGVTYRFL
jgi:hypothetical protein